MVTIEPPPAFSRSGSAARAQATSEYALTSSASQKRSRGVSVNRPSRSSAAANATEWTSRSSPPSNTSPTSEKTRVTSSSERTSHPVTSLPPTESASSRTELSMRSPWNVNASSARTYLEHLDRVQTAAVAELRRALPQAVVQERFRVVLDGLTVSLPVASLPRLSRLRFVTRVYPSVRYTIATNRSPHLIGADVLAAATGARGRGIKIGVVDDGIDDENAFFSPSGFSYPAGFPKG